MYDFETLVNRSNQGALKWLVLTEEDKKNGVIPYSVADMEFKIAPEIIEGLKAHLDTDILGYTGPTQEYFEFFEPVFNVADSAITIGIALILIFYRKSLSFESSKIEE